MLTLDEMVDRYRLSVDYIDSRGYGMSLLFAVACRWRMLQTLLDFCPYANFWGAPASGKSEATQYLCKISNGLFISKCTPPYLLRKMGDISQSGGVIAIDQYDDHVKAVDELDGIMEIGNRPTARYGLTEKDKKNIKTVELPCGGPKIFNSLIPPRQALRTRAWESHMVESLRALDIATYSNGQDIMDITNTLDTLGNGLTKLYSTDIMNRLSSSEHRTTIAPLLKYGARKLDIANVFELTRHFLGWNVDVIGALSYTQYDEDLDVFRSLLSSIAHENGWVDTERKPQDVLSALNEQYRAMNIKGVESARALSKLCADIGIEGDDCRRRLRDTTYYLFSAKTMKLLDTSVQMTIWGTQHLKGGGP